MPQRSATLTLVFTLSFSLPFVLEAADGDLDSSFSSDGKDVQDWGADHAYASRSPRRRTVRSWSVAWCGAPFRLRCRAVSPDGSLDTGFGDDGLHGSGSTSAALSPTPCTPSSRCPTARRCWSVPGQPRPSTFRGRAADGRRRARSGFRRRRQDRPRPASGHEHESVGFRAQRGSRRQGRPPRHGDARGGSTSSAVFLLRMTRTAVPDPPFSSDGWTLLDLPIASSESGDALDDRRRRQDPRRRLHRSPDYRPVYRGSAPPESRASGRRRSRSGLGNRRPGDRSGEWNGPPLAARRRLRLRCRRSRSPR